MAGKISEYANAVATFADGDLVDVSKRLSTSPDVFQSQKLEFAQFQAFIQANASNILNTNGLTLGGMYSHNLNSNYLTFTNGTLNISQGSLLVQAETNLGSTAVLFKKQNGDTMFNFLDNGNVTIGGNSTIDLGSNILTFDGDLILNSNVNAPNLPTASTGLSAGDFWNENGVVRVGTSGTGPSSIYTADGTIGAGRVATLTDTLTFKNGTVNVQGIGTAGSSALAIYDNDTTPNKLWDFLDNGDVQINQSSSFLLSANKTLKLNASSNTNQNVFEVNSGSHPIFGLGSLTIGEFGNLEIKGTNSNGNFKVLTILGNEYFTLDGNGNNSTLRTKAFDIGTSTTTGYKITLDSGKHEFVRNTIMGAKFDLVNSEVKFWEAGMTSRKFIIGGSSLIGTEKISLQDDTLLNANVNMPNLPSSATGLNAGDIYNDSGTLKIA